MHQNKTREELLIEVERLRAQLAEKEEILRAIRSGEVDALVVSGPKSDQIFTLKGADTPYRIIIESMDDGAATLTPNGTIIYCNRSFAKMLKTPLHKIVGTNISSRVEPAHQASFEEMLREAGARSVKVEVPLLADDGTLVPADIALSPFQVDDTPAICLIARDIKERKILEKQLRYSQRMESVGMLANGIAHDLNNILAPIMISLELLREEVKDGEGQKTIDLLERSAERGASLVKQVQSFARGAEGEHESLQIAHVLSEVGQIARETFPRNIEIKTDTDKNLWTILGDATQLHQVLMNLCVNARDAMMPDGGLLSISAENFDIDKNYARMHIDAKVGPYIVITVSDTGTGIPPEIQDKIFEPFFTTKEFGKGTGIGLSTALAIVKGHGGFINVYSEVGKGSAFKIYLPAVETIETQQLEEEELEIHAGHGEIVLVVEDEAPIREITCLTLQKYGYKVLTAKDGAEAVAVYTPRKREVKVVLMDLMMPSMDGEASIKVLRKMNPKIKIIAVSGLIEKERNIRAKDMAQALLPKPYTAKKLLKTLHETLNA